MSERKRILLIEDEPDVRHGLRKVFDAEGFIVEEAPSGELGLARVTEDAPDLIILDLMLPGLDGFQVCRELRAQGKITPVLVLTARSSEVDKVLGFELGADDYVTKPFGVAELVARVRALLRRAEARPGEPGQVVIGDVRVDLKKYKIEANGELMELYHYEAEILKLLVRREGEVVPREEILDTVWGRQSPTTRTVDFHICNLRKKIEVDPAKPRHILTVHGLGYRFAP